MALILLFKVMVALAILSCYGAAVLRLVNELFYSQFRKHLEAEYKQYPEMKNLDLDGSQTETAFVHYHDGGNGRADWERRDFGGSSSAPEMIQEPEEWSFSTDNVWEHGESLRDGYDIAKNRNGDGETGESTLEYVKNDKDLATDVQGKGTNTEAQWKNAFSAFESYDPPDHYYSILRSSRSGGHERDQKPQTDFTAETTGSLAFGRNTASETEWVSMSVSRSERGTGVNDNKLGDEFVAQFSTVPEDSENLIVHRSNFHPGRAGDYADGENDVIEDNPFEGKFDAPVYHQRCSHSETVSCDDQPVVQHLIDLDEFCEDGKTVETHSSYYCSPADDGERNRAPSHSESDYYYDGRDFHHNHQRDSNDAYREFHKYIDQLQHNEQKHTIDEAQGENNYGEEKTPSASRGISTGRVSTFPYYDAMTDSSSSVLLSKPSSYFIFLLSNLLVVKLL